MALPEKAYYSLIEAAELLECNLNDIYYFVTNGFIDITIKCDFEEYIRNKKVSIKAIIDVDKKLTKDNNLKYTGKYKTDLNNIKEKIAFSEMGKTVKRTPIKIKGLFSIREKALYTSNFFTESSEIIVNKFYINRLPIFQNVNLDEYNPRAIILHGEGIKITDKDLLITRQEIFLLKAGGITINWRLNKGGQSFSKLPKEITEKLSLVTNLMQEHLTPVIKNAPQPFTSKLSAGQKPHHLKQQIILIASDTKNHYLKEGLDIGLKAIAIKIKNHKEFKDKGLPSAEQMVKWFISAGIATSKTTKTYDFNLILNISNY